MKAFYLLLFSLLLFGTNSYAQYSETFDVPNKGILAGPCTTNDPTTCASNDFAGVDWTLEGDLSGLTAADDNFFTVGGVLRAMDVDEEICWLSPVLNMTGTASFSMDLTWLAFDNYTSPPQTIGSQDYIDVSYRIDGGSWVTLPNAVGGGPRTISYATTPAASNVDGSISGLGATGLTGTTLQIRVCVDVNAATELVTIDNVAATNATTGMGGPVCDLDLVGISSTNEDCPGASDGSITVNATTSNGPITYTLTGPVNASNQTGVFSNLPPGSYSVSLQDGSFAPGDCTESGMASIAAGVDTTPPTGQVSPITINCPDDVPAPDPSEVTNVDDNCQIPCVTEPWINEFHYDNIGTDVNEFIEVAGPAGIDLSLYELYTYDGFDGAVDQIFALSGIIPDEDNGFGAGFVLTPFLQNMTEGIALVKNGTEVIEFISYEGVVTATDGPAMGMTSVDVGVSESNDITPADGSLGRVGNGNKPGDFTWAVLTQTQGTLNTGQTISDCPDEEPVVTFVEDVITTPGAGTAGDPYVVTRTYRITDAAGNFVDVFQTITANNCCVEFPTASVSVTMQNDTICQGGTAIFDLTGTPESEVTFSINGGGNQTVILDVNGIATVTVSPANFNQFISLSQVENLSTGCVQALSDVALVAVQPDFIPPTVTCQDINADLDANGMVTILPGDVFASGSDNCGTVNLVSVVPNIFDCADIGIQTVTLTVNDGNGNTATCTADVDVRDLTPPVFECQDITVSLDANGTFVIPSANYVVDNIQTNYEDNCASGSSSFGITTSSWDCNDIGPNSTTITADDGNGNETSCTITVNINDDMNNCASPLSGTIRWEHNNNGVEDVTVTLSGDASDNTLTDISGAYELEVEDGNYVLTPSKTDDLLNGVSTFDVVLIQQHITFITPITDPYKLIAADVNYSNSISTLDALIIMQTILGNPTAEALFGDSWRFVVTDYNFPVPSSPWGFPESISLNNVNSAITDLDFIGVKKGDVNGSASPSSLWDDELLNRSGVEPLVIWQIQDRALATIGEEVEVHFHAQRFEDITAYQFGLGFQQTHLELLEVVPGTGLELTSENFGAFQADQGELRSLWVADPANETVSLGSDQPVFTLRFRVLQPIELLSEQLWIDETIILSESYSANGNVLGSVEIAFTDLPVSAQEITGKTEFHLFQNVPNPFEAQTLIGFYLPEAAPIRLRIFDAAGRLLHLTEGDFPNGYSEVSIDNLPGHGVLYYQLETPTQTAIRKMVKLNR